MPFPELEERPGDERRMKIEFALLLVAQLIILAAIARYLGNALGG